MEVPSPWADKGCWQRGSELGMGRPESLCRTLAAQIPHWEWVGQGGAPDHPSTCPWLRAPRWHPGTSHLSSPGLPSPGLEVGVGWGGSTWSQACRLPCDTHRSTVSPSPDHSREEGVFAGPPWCGTANGLADDGSEGAVSPPCLKPQDPHSCPLSTDHFHLFLTWPTSHNLSSLLPTSLPPRCQDQG